jgi:hypothetical protein
LFAQFPPEAIMSPEDLVDASWRSLALGELFCFPLLEDPQVWERAHEAIRAVGETPLSNRPAARYRV